MGNALKDQGRLEKTIEAYDKCITLRLNYSNVYFNMGNTLREHGRLDKAIEIYKRCIILNSDYAAECYKNIGIALKDQGKMEDALEAFNKTIKLKHDDIEVFYNIGFILKDIIFQRSNPDFYKTFISLIEQKSIVRPRIIAKSLISLLKLDPTLKFYLENICKD